MRADADRDEVRERMPFRTTLLQFERLVERALAELPEEFRNRFANIAVTVEDFPSREDAEDTGVPEEELLGLFRGVAHPEKAGMLDVPQMLPDEIVLYRRNIERICSSERELIDEIRLTVLHEVGHYFGLSEEDLEQYG